MVPTIPARYRKISRPALAKFLVDMARSGVREEKALAASGILHLVALAMERSKS